MTPSPYRHLQSRPRFMNRIGIPAAGSRSYRVMNATTLALLCLFTTGCTESTAANPQPERESSMFTQAEKKKYVISSPLEGVLMNGDQPLRNTTITRRLRWNGNEEGLVQHFTSDEQGRFSLPVHEEELVLGMFNQFVAKIELTVNGDDVIWYGNKMFPEIYAETNGPVQSLVCDISLEETAVFLGDSVVPNILTRCRWENMSKS